MAQNQIKCPACTKWSTERGIRLHFRQALSGWDPIWNPSTPHIKWARRKGIKVTDNGVTFDYDKLNDALSQYFSGH